MTSQAARTATGDGLTLTFTGKSNSEYFFALENPTSYPVYFRGIKSLWAFAIILDDALRILLCHRTDRDMWNLPGVGSATRLPLE
jgi:hypothetical protein